MSQFGKKAFSAGIQGGTFKFYSGKKFTGKSVVVEDGFTIGNLRQLDHVSSLKKIR